ncbi:hypothetical protein [Staphylococcus simulans]|uniref:hypothetical protein n=1 Tax=Staphylococcus simulans TaxID=1286 RepID=UPI003F7D6118
MKKLMAFCLGLVILLAACGNKVDGTYSNSDIRVTANSESGNATMIIKAMQSEGFFGVGENDGEFNGTVDKDNGTMNFDIQNRTMKLKYKVKGDKLIIEDPSGDTKDKLELTKE